MACADSKEKDHAALDNAVHLAEVKEVFERAA
jgi:hypothetical protein